MGTIRKTILIVGVVLIVLLAIFPPWCVQPVWAHSGNVARWAAIPAGFCCIFSPPHWSPDQCPSAMMKIWGGAPSGMARLFPYSGIRLDLTRLLVLWAAIVVATGTAMTVAPRGKNHAGRKESG